MNRTILSRTACAAALALALLFPGTASGEDADVEEDDDFGLEILFVTAERTVSNLQQTGGSVVLFTESMLEDRGIYDVKSITEYVPNVKIQPEIRYELRAEVPGTFHALPVMGHAMYVPEIRCNGAEVRLEVVDRP